jgi:hypothetical protein
MSESQTQIEGWAIVLALHAIGPESVTFYIPRQLPAPDLDYHEVHAQEYYDPSEDENA